MTRFLVLLACASTLLLGACSDGSALPSATGKAGILAINAIEASPDINFLIEERSIGTIPYKAMSILQEYDDLDYTFNFDVFFSGGTTTEEPAEASEQAPAGHGEARVGDRVRLPPIAERQGVGEDGLHAGGPRAARMVRAQRARPAQQVCQTRLMQCRGEAAIGRPPVPHQDAVEVGAQDLGRLVKTAPLANRIHRGVRGRERPQPVPHRADAPAGFVWADDGTPADLLAQGGIGRGGHAGRTMQHLHEASGRHRQPEALTQERGHFAERHTDLFVQERNQRDGARPQVDVGGAYRVRGLQRMPTLHAAPTLRALPDGDVKAPDDWLDDGEVFLILRRHAQQVQHPATPRTRLGKRGVVGRIDLCGNRAARPAPIPAAGPPPRPPAAALGPILGKRRGLPEPGPPRGRKLLLQALVLLFQPIPLPLPLVAIVRRACQGFAQPSDFCLLALDQRIAFDPRRLSPFICHTRFMADSPQKYKYKIVSLAASPAKQRPI